MKLELLEKEDTPQIRTVWESHHSAKDGKLGLVLEAQSWERFRDMAQSKYGPH